MNHQPQDGSAVPAGPSKNALKKAAKLAKKAAKANGASKQLDIAEFPAATSSGTVTNMIVPPETTGLSGRSLFLDTEGPGPLKCLAAARLFGVSVDAAATSPAGEHAVSDLA